jgi:hypothetical protein
MSPTKLEVPLKLDTLAAKMGPPPETEDHHPPNNTHHQRQPGATTSAIFSGGSGCSWGCERAIERGIARSRCTTTVVVLHHPEVVLPHLLHLTQLADKSQI